MVGDSGCWGVFFSTSCFGMLERLLSLLHPGVLRAGLGTGISLGRWCFHGPTSRSATGGSFVFTLGLKSRIYWLSLTCNLGAQIIYYESHEQRLPPLLPPPPGDGRWPSRNPRDLLANLHTGPPDGCVSGTQKRNVALWLLGRGGILLWLWQQANRRWLISLPASLVQHAFFSLLRDVPPFRGKKKTNDTPHFI